MSRDHYVSQVHLKNFYSPKLDFKQLYAIRKSDLKSFTTAAKDVCRIEEGNTNKYLIVERQVEDFLEGIEPKYNSVLKKMESGRPDAECIYVISGFFAYVYACSPTGMRCYSTVLKKLVEDSYEILDSEGFSPPFSPELNGKITVKAEIDPKYSQAIGIDSILGLINKSGNLEWEILINSFEDTPFFTSDYPIAIETTKNYVTNNIIPLSPTIAIKIYGQINKHRKNHLNDFSFSHFCYSVRKLNRDEIRNINRLIVRCAENLVFFSDDCEWIPNFVKKNSRFRIELIPSERRPYYEQKIIEFT